MKGVIVYKSKYGATAQYAKWLSADLQLPYFETSDLGEGDLNEYDYIILGTSVYVGKMLIKKWLNNNLKVIGSKKIFLYVVCGTPPDQKDKLNSYIAASVPGEIRNRCDTFFLPGKLKIKELSLLDLFILKMGASLAKSSKVKKAMLTDYNGIKQENLAELTDAINKTVAVKAAPLLLETIN